MKIYFKTAAMALTLLATANLSAFADAARDELLTRGMEAAMKGNYSEAETIFKQGQVMTEQPQYSKADRALSLRLLVKIYLDQKRWADAEPLVKRSIVLDEEGKVTEDLINDLDALAIIYLSQGHAAEAIPVMKRKIELDEKLPAAPAVLADDYLKIGLIYDRAGQTADCEEVLRKSLAIRDKIGDVNSSDLTTNLVGLATVCNRQEKYADAEQFYSRALAIKDKSLGPDSPELKNLLKHLQEIYDKLGNKKMSEEMQKRQSELKIDTTK